MSSFLLPSSSGLFLSGRGSGDSAEENRWLIFIAYLTGISIGVHLLNLVTIPALALVYHFKKYPKPSFFGGLMAFAGGLVVLAIINFSIIPGLPGLAGKFEIFFVNTFILPYKSGVIVFVLSHSSGTFGI